MSGLEQPQQACQFCRKQKRRCDKRFPQCGTCRRSGRECDYSSVTEKNDELNWLRTRVASLESALRNGSSVTTTRNSASSLSATSLGNLRPVSSPVEEEDLDMGIATWSPRAPPMTHHLGASLPCSAFFLDNPVFRQRGNFLTPPFVSIPQKLLDELGSAAEIEEIAHVYFDSIHLWLPIVSKRRLGRETRAPGMQPEPGISILLAAMKLLSQVPGPEHDPAGTPLYRYVKDYCMTLESRGFLSISVLQTSILIAVYEMGHGMYPAAYMSIGRCGRLGQVMGLHDKTHASPSSRPPTTWGEMEEVRRTWCAVLVLERHINIGFECRPLSAGGFSEDEILPCDTESWNKGDPAPSLPLFVESVTKLATDHFARTCQVAHLLGRIIDHRDDCTLMGPLRFTTAMQLLRTLNSLLELLKEEREAEQAGSLNVAYAMAFSAKTVLLNMYACTETNRRLNSAEETEMQALALGEFHAMVDEVVQFAQGLQLSQPTRLATLSPLICDCLYQGASTAAWYLNESGSDQMARSLDILNGCLRTIQSRWRVAHDYLILVESQRNPET